jgi:hypothetical protein
LQNFFINSDELKYWVAAPAVLILIVALYLFHKFTGAKKCVE